MDIKTPEDWWTLAIERRDDFKKVCKLVYSDPDRCNAEIKIMDAAYQDKNHDMLHYTLEQIWSDAPDAPMIHQWPSWFQLCDLCSEFWVFGEESK